MEYTTTVSVHASAEQAWTTLAALRDWPQWTPTVESLQTASDRPEIGQQVAMKQPGRRVAHYTIDVVEPGRRFRWGSDRRGVRQSADHAVTADGAVRILERKVLAWRRTLDS